MRATRTRLWWATAAVLALSCSSSNDEGVGAGGVAGSDFGNANNAGMSGTTGASGASGTTGGDGSSGTAGSVPTECAQGSARTARVVPRVILVVDGSCSMSTDYPLAGGQSARMCFASDNSRWSALRSALLDPNSGIVARLAGVIEFGIVVFGTQPTCPLASDPIQPALDNLAAIDGALPSVPPGMFTPTGAALRWVYENMIEPESPDDDRGPQIVVLATDGEPNSCDSADPNYQPSIDAVQQGQALGVETYVVSLANAAGEFHEHLQQLANIGASAASDAPLYEPGTPEELAADLEQLIGGRVGCDLALNGEVQSGLECQATVTLNGRELGCNDPDGWVLTDSRHIRLQGIACQELMADADALLQADFACSIFTPD